LKIGWDIARALLTEAEWTVLPLDFLNVGGSTNQDVGGPFHHFGYFFVYHSFDNIICSNDRQGLDSIHVVDQQFYSRQLFAALASMAMNFSTSVIVRIGGGRGI
jgi:hypothetical protein